ncbi:hypothetical protein ABPG75_006423 [Micractinium tetrahymenae]
MRLLLRSPGCPVPSAVEAESQDTLQALVAQLRQSGKLGDTCDERLRLVHRGRVLRQRSARLCDVCSDSDVLVLLPGRPAAAPRPPPGPPSKGPSPRDINAAIREDLAAQGPGTLAAAEAAARRQEAAAAGRGDDGAAAGAARLEDMLLSGEMGALREYLEQLQEALRGPGGAAAGAGGGGGGAGGAGGAGNLAAALDAFFGLPLAGQLPGGVAGGQAAGQDAADEEEDDVEEEEGEEGEFTDEEEEEEDGEGEYSEEEEYTDEEDGEEEGAGAPDQPGAQLLPPRVPELDSAALGGLMEMGFPEALCRNALLMGRNRFETALEWLLSHAEDPAAAEPLSDVQLARLYGRGPPRQGPAVDPGSLAHLIDIGFDPAQAEQALRAFNNSLPAAASWLLSLGTAAAVAAAQPGAVAAAEAGAGDGGAGPSSSGSQEQHEQAGQREQHEQEPDPGQVSDSDDGGSRHSGGELAAAGAAQHDDDAMPALHSDAGSSGSSHVGSEALSDDAASDAMPQLAASTDGGSSDGGNGGDAWEEAQEGEQLPAEGRSHERAALPQLGAEGASGSGSGGDVPPGLGSDDGSTE